MKWPEHEERFIREYVEAQARPEKVLHLEKLRTEYVYDTRYDAWDVRTDGDRYWVITSPTNLYSQDDYQSLDYTISFHIGVTTRVMSRDAVSAPEGRPQVLLASWRRWEGAAEAFQEADEAEAFQGVAIRCREILIQIIGDLADPAMIPNGTKPPQKANVLAWSQLIANTLAPGETNQPVRAYLKSTFDASWQLVGAVQHKTNASRFDARLALDAAANALSAMSTVVHRHFVGPPERCPECRSYRVVTDVEMTDDDDVNELLLCEKCGWSKPIENNEPAEDEGPPKRSPIAKRGSRGGQHES